MRYATLTVSCGAIDSMPFNVFPSLHHFYPNLTLTSRSLSKSSRPQPSSVALLLRNMPQPSPFCATFKNLASISRPHSAPALSPFPIISSRWAAISPRRIRVLSLTSASHPRDLKVWDLCSSAPSSVTTARPTCPPRHTRVPWCSSTRMTPRSGKKCTRPPTRPPKRVSRCWRR